MLKNVCGENCPGAHHRIAMFSSIDVQYILMECSVDGLVEYEKVAKDGSEMWISMSVYVSIDEVFDIYKEEAQLAGDLLVDFRGEPEQVRVCNCRGMCIEKEDKDSWKTEGRCLKCGDKGGMRSMSCFCRNGHGLIWGC
jgi:hypothetical protein